MAAPLKRVLFLDGIGCNPEGFKPTYLRGLGYQVTAPQLPDLDFAEAVAAAERAHQESSAEIIVGYSRGGSVAMMLSDTHTPRVLIAPALQWVADSLGFAGRLIVIHAATDDSLPLEDVRRHLVRCALTTAELRVVGADHTMIDPGALSALTKALAELAGGDERP